MDSKTSILDKVIWFCSSCESANKIIDLNCVDCNTPLKVGDTIFNIETFQSTTPEQQCGKIENYFVDGGGVSLPKDRDNFYATWSS